MTLPKGWVETTVGEVVRPIETANPAGELNSTFRYVDIGAIDNRLLSITEPKEILGRDAPSRARRRIRNGDILFSTVRPYLKNIAQVPADLDGEITSTGICVLRGQEGVESGFLFRRVASQDFIDAMTRASDGTMYPAIADKDVFSGAISLPPAAEQRRIVAKLDALTARLARARAELDRVPVLAERLREVALRKAYSPVTASAELGEALDTSIDGRTLPVYSLAVDWTWHALGTIAAVTGGLTKNAKRATLQMQVPYLRVANVYANALRLDDIATIGCTPAELTKTRVEPGDILVVEGNGSLDQVGRAAVWSGEIAGCSHQNHLIRVRAGASVLPEFLLWWLLSPEGRSRIERLAASTSGLHTLSISKISGLPIPAPSLPVQETIVSSIKSAFARADRMEAEAARARALIDRLEAAILAKAFRGELVPQDPDDEPAGVLLDRIREARAAGRAAAPRAKRGRRKREDAT